MNCHRATSLICGISFSKQPDEVTRFKGKWHPDLPSAEFEPASHSSGFQVLRGWWDKPIANRAQPSKTLLLCEWDGGIKVTVVESGNETSECYTFDIDKGFRSNEGGARLTHEELAEKILKPFLWDKQ